MIAENCPITIPTVHSSKTPPVTHGPQASSMQVDCPIAGCAFA